MKILRSALLKALEIVRPATSSSAMKNSDCFIFNNTCITAYNGKMQIDTPIEGLDFEGAVKAAEFQGILEKFKKDEVTITVNGNELLIVCGQAKAGIRLLDNVQPSIKTIGKKWSPLPENFNEALPYAIKACGKDNSRPLLTCVHINEAGFVEGSDGFGISRKYLTGKLPVGTFLIKSDEAAIVAKLQPVEVSASPSVVYFKNAEGTIASCAIFAEDKYVSTEAILNKKGSLLALPKNIIEMMNQAKVFAKRKEAFDENIGITINNGRFTLRSESEHGWFEESTLTRYNGPVVSFSISPYLLRSIMVEGAKCSLAGNTLKFEGEDWVYVALLKN